jgi:hypothetical protein
MLKENGDLPIVLRHLARLYFNGCEQSMKARPRHAL